MPSSSRIVFAEDLADAKPWQPGALEGAPRRGARLPRDREAAPAAPGYEDGLRAGFAQGVAHEQQAAADRERERLAQIAARGDALLAAFAAQLAALQHQAADDVIALAVEIARRTVGAALAVRPDHVVPVVGQALQALADDRSAPVVHLNPDDAALLADALEPLLAARGARLLPDAAVSPGGCVVETPRAGVDATLRTRWRRTLAAIGRDDEWVDT